MLAQTAPPVTASEPAAQPQPLPQAESFEFLTSLNKAKKIFSESYLLPLRDCRKGVLKAENCFGVRLANGLRLVGDSNRARATWEHLEVGSPLARKAAWTKAKTICRLAGACSYDRLVMYRLGIEAFQLTGRKQQFG